MSDPDAKKDPGGLLPDRYSAKPMNAAYQGSMEAVFSIAIAILLGWWADRSFETSPWGVLVGATIGFAAFVVRLTRLGSAMSAPSDDETSPQKGPGEGDKTENDDRLS